MVNEPVNEPVNAPARHAIFEQYIAAGLAWCWQQVQAGGDHLPEEARNQACHLLSLALRLPQCWPAARDLLLALDPLMQRAGYREPWLVYLQTGLACAERAGDWPAAAQLRLAGGELLRHLGQYDTASLYFEQALAAAQTAGDPLQVAAAKVGLGNLALLREEWENALRWCREVLDAVPAPHRVRARALFVAAGVQAARHESAEADSLYRQSEAVWDTLGNRRWVALCRQNQARLAAQRGDATAARSLYGAAHATFASLDIPYSLAVVKMNWGIVEHTTGNQPAALTLYQEAETIFRLLKDSRYLAMICNNIGLLYRQDRQWQPAEAYYVESIHLWRQLGVTLARISVQIDLGKVWLDSGDPARALTCFRQLAAELRQTERDAEHRRLYAELQEYTTQALAAASSLPDTAGTYDL
jgi:tetratricopeptide (TPR) repeat protein